ncbi:hypothetical protein LIER_02051 [Lithospermum erythrorhizon]|uniref:Uncharacterized protein n=1 Tax=Lithospermum erythrorhizon TaxID=34254 RepID=A0AAV3NPB1_LITER
MGITSEVVSYQMDGVTNSSEAKRRWVVSGIALRAPLMKPICTKPVSIEEENDEEATTPTSKDSRILSRFLTCPQAPKKRKTSSKFHHFDRRDFFHVPDLETVFKRHVEKT